MLMVFLFSPAKQMRAYHIHSRSNLNFKKETIFLMKELKKWSVDKIMTQMKLSINKAKETHHLINAWGKKSNKINGAPAIFGYIGEAYKTLDAANLQSHELQFLKEHLIILSALYGALNPMDCIEPYRLEMAQSGLLPKGTSLYSFWKKPLNDFLVQYLKTNQKIVNLASSEYSNVLVDSSLIQRMITPSFLEYKNGQLKTISVFSKQGRGAMLKWCAQQKIQEPEEIKKFDLLGYRFNSEISSDTSWCFTR